MHLVHTDTCHTASIHTHIHILHLANFSVIYQYIQIQTDIHKIHTDTCHTVHIHTHMHISHLANFLPVRRPRSRPAAQWGGSDGRADSDNRAVTTSAVAASRAGKFTAWKSQKELVRSAGLSAAGPGQAVSRWETVNATINPQQQIHVMCRYYLIRKKRHDTHDRSKKFISHLNLTPAVEAKCFQWRNESYDVLVEIERMVVKCS